jgi:hypothetical protein
MEWYRLIFFHVFKVYYRDGDFRNDVPWFTATVLISASLWTYFTRWISILFLRANPSKNGLLEKIIWFLGNCRKDNEWITNR